jgi:hypothetical protein
MPRKPDVIDAYAKRGGPLPTRGSGSIATGFWRGYQYPDLNDKTDTIQGRAVRAGKARAKAEPGLSH